MFFLCFLCFVFTSWSCLEILARWWYLCGSICPVYFQLCFLPSKSMNMKQVESIFREISKLCSILFLPFTYNYRDSQACLPLFSSPYFKILFPCHYGTDYYHYYLTCFPAIMGQTIINLSLLLDMFSLCFISGIICIGMRISWELFMINT